MKTYTLCDGPGPNPDCPALVIHDDGSAEIGEDKEGVGTCHLTKRQFALLKDAIQTL